MTTTFVITIDVESRADGNSRRDVLGVLDGHPENFGIQLMMDLLERHHARGTFFLNVYETAKYGEESIATAARLIHARGHDLELHTHPLPMFGHYGMNQSPFDEQVEILRKGVSLIEGWTGKRVSAHRAGSFEANVDTLRAMQAVGLVADSSLAPGSRIRRPLEKELGVSNLARPFGRVWEVPVTYFDQLRLGPWHLTRTLDLEGNSLAEIRKVTRLAIRQGLPTVCLLMHSFSFVRHHRPDPRVIERFSALLEWLEHQEGVEIGTMEQAIPRLAAMDTRHSVPLPAHAGLWLVWRRALSSWNEGWKNLAVGAIGAVFLAVVAALIVYFGFGHLRR